MQKQSKEASILIWAIFLSLVISISFLSISSKINKNLKLNWKLNDNIDTNLKIENKIKSKNYTDELIDGNTAIIFWNNNYYEWTIKKYEKFRIKFNWTSNTGITLNKITWWDIYYNYYNWNQSLSWIVSSMTGITLELSPIYNSWILEIETLWWLSNFSLSWATSFLLEEQSYKTIKKVWNKNLIETQRIIKNF